MRGFVLGLVLCLMSSLSFAQDKEIFSLRTYNQKCFDLGNESKNYKIHIAQIHYKDNGEFKDIDTKLSFDNGKWHQEKASYHCVIPEYADDWFEFYNGYEGADHTIKAKPVCKHIKGEYFNGEDGNGVIYKNAFADGIDLKVYAYWAGLKKVIIINEKPVDISTGLTFDFELELLIDKSKVKNKNGNIWNKVDTLSFKDKTLLVGNDGKESFFRNALVWDSGNIESRITEAVDIELYAKNSKIYLKKTVTKDILENAVYPLYTDHPTSYFVGAGDGHVEQDGGNWATAHDATQGTSATPTATSGYCRAGVWNTSTTMFDRTFLPVDTSGIEDTATITAATLYVFVTEIGDYDNGTNYDWVNVLQTSQADPTTLTVADYDAIGTTTGATNIDLGAGFTDDAYNGFTLNATGIGWIDKVNVNNTLLGLRVGFDVLDSFPWQSYPKYNYIEMYFSEYTGTASDPYLDVTTSGGAATRGQVIMFY